MGKASIAKATKEDPVLRKFMNIIRKRQNWIPTKSPDKLKKFKPIFGEIAITGNDILVKSDRIILPRKTSNRSHIISP